MIIQCTHKLLKALKIKPEIRAEYNNPVLAWHAHLIEIDNKDLLILLNDCSRYIVVIPINNLEECNRVIIESLRASLKAENIDLKLIDKFIPNNCQITYSKTNGKASVGKLMEACLIVKEYYHINNSINFLNKKINRHLVLIDNKNLEYPFIKLISELENYLKFGVINSLAVQLKISLVCDDLLIWRQLIIPLNYNLEQLHLTIQAAFSWKLIHTYSFNIINAITDSLSKIYLNHQVIEYYYDSWKHIVFLEKIIDNYKNYYPTCIDGYGFAPPEDIGGIVGYKKFLDIINNSCHDDYQLYNTLANKKGYEDFNIFNINRKLKLVSKDLILISAFF